LQVLGANFELLELHAHATAAAFVAVEPTIDGVNTNGTPPADPFPVAEIMQSEVIFDDAINFVMPGANMLLHAFVLFMLFETIASDASCLGPVVAIKTSVARDRVK
jgi:hypothetical protein